MLHQLRRRDFLAASLLPLAAAGLKRPGRSESVIAGLESLLPKLMDDTCVPGLSIALVKAGKLHWRRGFGVKDSASKKPVHNDTVFEAASVSKSVFAYAVLKLCERGILDLDAPLTRYTAERFLEGDPRLDLITARHVLSHTTGFQNWRSDKEPLKIHFTPGSKYSYSGEGYSYLQWVVTHLTGQPIEQYMKANIFAPFGMMSSGYVWNDIFEKHAARPHDPEGKPLDNRKRTPRDVARYAAAGDLHTTPTDYAKFLIEVIDPKPGDAFRLGRDSLREMLRPQVKADPGTSWALGWQIRHTNQGDFIQHGGDNLGFHAFISASVERKSGFALMTNGENGWKLIRNQALWDMLNRFLAG